MGQQSIAQSFSEAFSSLAHLETFDKKAFVGNSAVSQKVCNFVLTLAVIYNDIKNIHLFNELLKTAKPIDTTAPTKEQGEYTGIQLYIRRLIIGVTHELLNLIYNHNDCLDNDFFKQVIESMNKSHRQSWNNLVAAANKRSSTDIKINILMFVRNKISFHYDLKEIFSGFDVFFNKKPQPIYSTPFISRGRTMLNSRFYFADATVDGYFNKKIKEDQNIELDTFYDQLSKLLYDVNFSLYGIVCNFIQKRGLGWKRFDDTNTQQ